MLEKIKFTGSSKRLDTRSFTPGEKIVEVLGVKRKEKGITNYPDVILFDLIFKISENTIVPQKDAGSIFNSGWIVSWDGGATFTNEAADLITKLKLFDKELNFDPNLIKGQTIKLNLWLDEKSKVWLKENPEKSGGFLKTSNHQPVNSEELNKPKDIDWETE